MKKIIFFLVFCQLTSCYSQQNVFLKDLNQSLLKEINNQGMRTFEKTKFSCNKNLDLYAYPQFTVDTDSDFSNIDFQSESSILSNLFFKRESKKGLLNSISWNILNIRDSLVYTSDFKKYYRYNLNDGQEFFGGSYKKLIKKIDLNTIKFSFSLYNFDGFVVFYVTNDNKILVRDERIEKWMTLEEFDKELKENKYHYEKR